MLSEVNSCEQFLANNEKSSRSQMFLKVDVFKNFEIFTEKVSGKVLKSPFSNFIEKETRTPVFSC